MEELNKINVFGTEIGSLERIEVTTDERVISTLIDARIFANKTDCVIILNYNNNENGVKADIVAINDCSVTYYTDSETTEILEMDAGTRAEFIYYNGWKYYGAYGAVWN